MVKSTLYCWNVIMKVKRGESEILKQKCTKCLYIYRLYGVLYSKNKIVNRKFIVYF